jgi:hypothetical protein
VGAPPPLGRCPPSLGPEQYSVGWSLSVMVYTAMVWAAHRWVLSGATSAFQPRARGEGLVTAWAPPCLGRCIALFFSRAGSSWGWPGWSPPPLQLEGAPPCPVPGTAMFGALADNSPIASTTLFGLGAINRGGAWPWAGY